jgi:hypothetical protein
VSITEYAWEDINENRAKIYLTKNLDGVKNLDISLITCDFGTKTVDLKIKDFKGKNWRFKMEPLFDLLAPEKCKLNIKSNSISIVLEKKDSKQWTSLK